MINIFFTIHDRIFENLAFIQITANCMDKSSFDFWHWTYFWTYYYHEKSFNRISSGLILCVKICIKKVFSHFFWNSLVKVVFWTSDCKTKFLHTVLLYWSAHPFKEMQPCYCEDWHVFSLKKMKNCISSCARNICLWNACIIGFAHWLWHRGWKVAVHCAFPPSSLKFAQSRTVFSSYY